MQIKILWRQHDIDRVRVWRSDWLFDQFEIVNSSEMEVIEEVMKTFGIPVEEAEG